MRIEFTNDAVIVDSQGGKELRAIARKAFDPFGLTSDSSSIFGPAIRWIARDGNALLFERPPEKIRVSLNGVERSIILPWQLYWIEPAKRLVHCYLSTGPLANMEHVLCGCPIDISAHAYRNMPNAYFTLARLSELTTVVWREVANNTVALPEYLPRGIVVEGEPSVETIISALEKIPMDTVTTHEWVPVTTVGQRIGSCDDIVDVKDLFTALSSESPPASTASEEEVVLPSRARRVLRPYDVNHQRQSIDPRKAFFVAGLNTQDGKTVGNVRVNPDGTWTIIANSGSYDDITDAIIEIKQNFVVKTKKAEA